MFATIIKKNENLFSIIDPYYHGHWESDRDSIIVYLELLNLLMKYKTKIIKKVYEELVVLCREKYDYQNKFVNEITNFVDSQKLPKNCIFYPLRLINNLSKYDEGIITSPTPIIEVTNKCNYRCNWCYIPTRNTEKEMSFETIKNNLVEPFIEEGLTSWCLSGGEPSVDVDKTLKVARLIKEKSLNNFGIKPEIYLLTNGYKLKQYAPLYKKAGITSIQVALTSMDENIELSLRKPQNGINSYQQAIEGIREINKRNFVTEINMIIQPKNRGSVTNFYTVEEMFDFANEEKVDVLRLIPAVPTGKAMENKIFFDQEDYEELKKIMSKIRKKKLKNPNMILDCPIDQPVDADSPIYCRAGTLFLYIDYAGHVFPCNNLQTDEAECWEKTVKETSITKIWRESTLLKEFRDFENAKISNECIGCDYRAECVGECRALCWAKYKQFDLKTKPDECYKEIIG